jgi:hypothetical protein
MRISALAAIIAVLLLGACNNHFHELIPPDEDRILSFTVPGQTQKEIISNNTVTIYVEKGVDITSLLPSVRVSPKAKFIPVTLDYIHASFPSADVFTEIMALYRSNDLSTHVMELIRENRKTFSVPAIDMPIDFGGPVDFLVIAALGNIRRYTVLVLEDSGEPSLLGMRFSKYDNPELIADALCRINENSRTVSATAMYPVEMNDLSFSLVPSFQILGDSMEVDGVVIRSGVDAIQFAKIMSTPQTKTLTLKRGDETKDYALTIVFAEDPDTIRSITDFRFNKIDNPGIAANAVASIINTENTGLISVQVFYSGPKPATLTARFITPGTASVGGIAQTSGISAQDFSSLLEYRVVSRNGLYMRVYTVRVEMLSLTNNAPRITSFRFSQNLNHDLVQDTVAEISDGLIILDVYYGSPSAPETLTPEFLAGGIVTVSGSVQVSGASAQDFSRQMKYTVTHPEMPQLTRDYWVQARFTRDTSSDAKINTFGFYPEENPLLADTITGKIDQINGKISIYAPSGSGATSQEMIPRFTAVGQLSVGGSVQTSGVSSRIFNAPVTYTVTSANGKNSKTYTVELRELRSTIFVDHRAQGNNDGINWQDAFISLQLACEAASQFPEEVPKEIWIAAGTYKPGSAAENYFPLTANTSYLGGFAGNETAKSQRNASAHQVIITGDLGGGRYSNNLFGAFNGNNAITVNGDLSFEDLIFNDAKAVMSGNRGNGAAINSMLADEMELRINGCSFNGFTANGNGGAVYVSGGSAGIIDSVIEDAQAVSGGAVYSSSASSLTINNLSITNSGGIYNYGGTLSIDKLALKNISGIGINQINGEGVTLSGIDADGISGSAVYCDGISGGSVILGGNSKFINTGRVYVTSSVSVQVMDMEIRNNSGDSALFVDSGSRSTTIERVIIDGVPNGRGIYTSSTNSVWINDSQIKNCTTTTGNGGGIRIDGLGDHLISGVTIENVEANVVGAVFSDSKNSLTIKNSIITNVRYSSNNIHLGNIYSGDGTLTVDNLTLRDITGDGINKSGNGGSVFLSGIDASGISGNAFSMIYGGALTVDGFILRDITGRGISKNGSGGVSLSGIDANGINGEAVYCDSISSGSVSMMDSKFYNTGQVYVSSSVPIQIADIEIRNNLGGSALYVNSGSAETTIERVTIDGVPNGRGIYASSDNSVQITSSSVRNCRGPYDSNGAGISLQGPGNLKISGVTIENCTVAYGGAGGGIYLNSSGNNEISGATIENVTAGQGGGIYDPSSNNLSISNTNIKNAEANNLGGSYRGGGGLCYNNSSGKLVITDSRFENCRSVYQYGAIYIPYPSVGHEVTGTDFINCISNTSPNFFFPINFAFIRNCTFTHDNNLVDVGSPKGLLISSIASGYFEGCTFNNLKGKFHSSADEEKYLFSRYGEDHYPNISNGNTNSQYDSQIGKSELTLRNCTFNFNAESAGLMALGAFSSDNSDTLLMEGCTINYSGGGKQPLIWLNGNTPTGRYQFKANNYYNGTLLNNAAAITGLGAALIRITRGATPVIVP